MSLRRLVEKLRPDRHPVSAWDTPVTIQSMEHDRNGGQVHTLAVFLVGAECPFRCTMCDLWKGTLTSDTPAGAIPEQIRLAIAYAKNHFAFGQWPHRQWLKLYNASNFFDPRSIPTQDLPEIANLCNRFERVIVENHPQFCDQRMRPFADAIEGKLEVAMGLETIHAGAMSIMNKSMTLDLFDRAIENCHELSIDTRAFVLLHPPGIPLQESAAWACKTIQHASDRGVRHISVIPVRSGNGWIDDQIGRGLYALPNIGLIRECLQLAQNLPFRPGTTLEFDLWDWEKIPGGCEYCRNQLYEAIVLFNEGDRSFVTPERPIDCECEL